MIAHIDHINIVVSNLKSATAFFTDHLGFTETKSGYLEGKWISEVVGLDGVKAHYVQLSLPEGGTNLELICYHNPAGLPDAQVSEANGQGLRHMALRVTQIETHYERLALSGISIFSEIRVYNEHKKLFYFLGPEGVIIELCEYDDF
ncbi:MAG: catechol 2,3-dioxygenase-like lactoylglutathione lyase family enzyme [Candidatus Marinamargulisbacteria bacterium]|jgi:catechol 2,3-dioxygenase-like lactoylglutathione lyase family enzyme